MKSIIVGSELVLVFQLMYLAVFTMSRKEDIRIGTFVLLLMAPKAYGVSDIESIQYHDYVTGTSTDAVLSATDAVSSWD